MSGAGISMDLSPQPISRADLEAAVRSVLAPAPAASAPAPAPASWGALAANRATAAAPPPAIGVALPLRLELPDGSTVKPLLLFGPECSTPEVLPSLIEALVAARVPLDTWRPKSDDGGGRGGWSSRGRGGWR